MSALTRLRQAARRIKHDALTVYFAARDPRTPVAVRLLAVLVAAYALSPIDLIPDFVPVLGYLDDVILLPLGILLVVKLTPAEVIESSRAKARDVAAKPVSVAAACAIVAIWTACAVAVVYAVLRMARA